LFFRSWLAILWLTADPAIVSNISNDAQAEWGIKLRQDANPHDRLLSNVLTDKEQI
jgi:hypothetical protein